jgi:hypothetical protein
MTALMETKKTTMITPKFVEGGHDGDMVAIVDADVNV